MTMMHTNGQANIKPNFHRGLISLKFHVTVEMKHINKQESRAAARKPRDAASVLFC